MEATSRFKFIFAEINFRDLIFWLLQYVTQTKSQTDRLQTHTQNASKVLLRILTNQSLDDAMIPNQILDDIMIPNQILDDVMLSNQILDELMIPNQILDEVMITNHIYVFQVNPKARFSHR